MPLIYIVEDDANIREIEQFSLESAGYSTRVFTCAKDFTPPCWKRRPRCACWTMPPDEDGSPLWLRATTPARADETAKRPS
ncbi:MAG: hypothetical protein ACLRPX_07190 [Ruthenibacterium sp.]